jgi:hypothetical protein
VTVCAHTHAHAHTHTHTHARTHIHTHMLREPCCAVVARPTPIRKVRGSSGAVVARPTPMQKVRGSSPVTDKDFRVRMRRPKYLGLLTFTSFG